MALLGTSVWRSGATSRHRAIRWFGALFLLAMHLGTPVGAADGQRAVRSLLEMREEGVVVQKWDLSCGAAALATILNYQHGDPVSEREIATSLIGREEYLANPMLIRARHGFSLLDLKRYVDRRDYEGVGYGNLTFEDLIDLAPIMCRCISAIRISSCLEVCAAIACCWRIRLSGIAPCMSPNSRRPGWTMQRLAGWVSWWRERMA